MPFKPGQSGNPDGSKNRVKGKQIATLLLPHVKKAVDAILESLGDPDNKLKAAKEILDRVYGKSKESVELSGTIESIVVNVVKKDK